MTAKGYVQAHMLDYFLGYNMDAPKKPDIEIIGGSREMSFAEVNVDETDVGDTSAVDANVVADADSSDAGMAGSGAASDSTENTTALSAANVSRTWNVTRGMEGIVLNSGAQSLVARLFDLNGKLLASKNLQRGASWEIPATGVPTLLQIKNGSRAETMRLGIVR